jgi:hypothetical protein
VCLLFSKHNILLVCRPQTCPFPHVTSGEAIFRSLFSKPSGSRPPSSQGTSRRKLKLIRLEDGIILDSWIGLEQDG